MELNYGLNNAYRNYKTTYAPRLKHEFNIECDSTTVNVAYQWYLNDKPIQGATNKKYTFPVWEAGLDGLYKCKLTASGMSKFTLTSIVTTDTSLPVIKITKQDPAGTIYKVNEGDQLKLTVAATTSDALQPLSYLWVINSKPTEITTPEITVDDVEHMLDGVWSCVIRSGDAVAFSNLVNVQVKRTPYLKSAHIPTSVTVHNNTNLFMGCAAVTNDKTVEYQWYRAAIAGADWSYIPGATKPSYETVMLTGNAFKYKCKVRSPILNKIVESGECVPTSTGDITISFTTQPVAASVRVGYTHEFKAPATTNDARYPLVYQWLHEGEPIVNANQSSLVVDNIKPTDQGNYKCVVTTGEAGYEVTLETTEAMLTVDETAATINITTQPQSLIQKPSGVEFGANVVATTNDKLGIKYRWFKNGKLVEGQDHQTIWFASPSEADSGEYFCELSSGIGAGKTVLNSANCLIEVDDEFESTINISNNLPATVDMVQGEVKSLSVVANTDGWPLKYQWFKDDKVIVGETGRELAFKSSMKKDSGVYKCKVMSGNESLMSAACAVTVAECTTVIDVVPLQHHIITMKKGTVAGGKALLTADAKPVTAGQALTYQWYKNGVQIASGTGKSWEVKSIPDTDPRQFFCEITCGNQKLRTNVCYVVACTAKSMKYHVHPLPHRNTSFMYVNYWVLDEINRWKAIPNVNWIGNYTDMVYSEEVETILSAIIKYGTTLMLESRNGRIIAGTLLE